MDSLRDVVALFHNMNISIFVFLMRWKNIKFVYPTRLNVGNDQEGIAIALGLHVLI